jgi:hypothetical protein
VWKNVRIGLVRPARVEGGSAAPDLANMDKKDLASFCPSDVNLVDQVDWLRVTLTLFILSRIV